MAPAKRNSILALPSFNEEKLEISLSASRGGASSRDPLRRRSFVVETTQASKPDPKFSDTTEVPSARLGKLHLEEKQKWGSKYNLYENLFHSCRAGDVQMVRFLVTYCGCDPDYEFKLEEAASSDVFQEGDTLEVIAQRYENEEMLSLLRELREKFKNKREGK
mmetsp:Transcript_6592/g.8775  ORF Transcript_6592/g.8775 Transcript_6592/m.8775 type:complete len:163 (-) Transcript_6592:709-1197(-)